MQMRPNKAESCPWLLMLRLNLYLVDVSGGNTRYHVTTVLNEWLSAYEVALNCEILFAIEVARI